MKLNTYGDQLKTLKVAFVFTVVENSDTDNGINSKQDYSYSGLYTVVDPANYNKKTIINKGDFNNLFEDLPSVKQSIYGLSSFSLNGCESSFNIDLELDSLRSYTLTLDNADQVSDVIFQADIFTKQLKQICSTDVKFTSLI